MQWGDVDGITIVGVFLFKFFLRPYFSYFLSSFLIHPVIPTSVWQYVVVKTLLHEMTLKIRY